MRCSSSALSDGDCAPGAPWICPARASPQVLHESAFEGGPCRPASFSVVLRPPPAGNQLFRRLRLPPPRVASQRRASFGKFWAACDSGLDLERLGTSVGQAPVHRVPRPSFRRSTYEGRASLSQSRLSTSANETYSVRAHPRDRLRARLESRPPLRGSSSPDVCQSRTPTRVSPNVRAVGSAPWKHDRSGFAPTALPFEQPARCHAGSSSFDDEGRGTATDRLS